MYPQSIMSAAPLASTAGPFTPVALALVRRTFPSLFANSIVGVQPMGSPVGLAYSLRTMYPTFTFTRYKKFFEIWEQNIVLAMKITDSWHNALLNKNNEDEGIRKLCIEVLGDRRLRCQ